MVCYPQTTCVRDAPFRGNFTPLQNAVLKKKGAIYVALAIGCQKSRSNLSINMNGVAVIIMSCLSHDFDIFMHVFRPVFKVSHLNIYILTLKHRPNEFGH